MCKPAFCCVLDDSYSITYGYKGLYVNCTDYYICLSRGLIKWKYYYMNIIIHVEKGRCLYLDVVCKHECETLHTIWIKGEYAF